MASPSMFLFVLFLALASPSDGSYCMCNSGLSDSLLQKNIDYACGSGADCSAILQNGACFNPNTVKDHCNYAVNSYYQRKAQSNGTCDFQGTAAVSQTGPTDVANGCVYQASPSGGGSTTPGTGGGSMTPGTGGGSTIPGGSLPPTGSSFDNGASVEAVGLARTVVSFSISIGIIMSRFI